MANTNQARKRARQAVARNQHLSAQRSQYRTAIKSVRKFIVAGDKAGAAEAFKKAPSIPLVSIEELQKRAEGIVGKPKPIEYTDRTVALVEYRDGTLIDEVKQIKD